MGSMKLTILSLSAVLALVAMRMAFLGMQAQEREMFPPEQASSTEYRSPISLENARFVRNPRMSGYQRTRSSSRGIAVSEEMGGPILLLQEEDRAYFLPTRETFVAWLVEDCRQPEELVVAAWEMEGVQDAWAVMQEKRALQAFIVEYQEREHERWRKLQASIPLLSELGDQISWFDRVEDPHLFTHMLSQYSAEAISMLWVAGDDVGQLDDPASLWQLMAFMSELPKVNAAAETITSALKPVEDSQ